MFRVRHGLVQFEGFRFALRGPQIVRDISCDSDLYVTRQCSVFASATTIIEDICIRWRKDFGLHSEKAVGEASDVAFGHPSPRTFCADVIRDGLTKGNIILERVTTWP